MSKHVPVHSHSFPSLSHSVPSRSHLAEPWNVAHTSRVRVNYRPYQGSTVAPSTAQNTAAGLESSDEATRNNLNQGVTTQLGTAQGSINQSQPTLNKISAINPNTGTTALRQALTNSMTSATSNAYQNAEAASRAQAAGSGFAGQPVAIGNQQAIGAQEAQALGQIPAQVEQQASGEELQAAGLENQQAGLETGIANTGLGQANLYNPNQALSTEAQLQGQLYNQINQQNQANSSLWQGLSKAGLAAAATI